MLQFQNLQKKKKKKRAMSCTLGKSTYRDSSMTINTNAGSAGINIPKNKIILAK